MCLMYIRLMLGFMLPTWFLSMWISNTATTAMMIPVAEAVLTQLKVGVLKQVKDKRGITGDLNYFIELQHNFKLNTRVNIQCEMRLYIILLFIYIYLYRS